MPARTAFRRWAADHCAARLLSRSWTIEPIEVALLEALGPRDARARATLADRLMALGEVGPVPSQHALAAFLVGSDLFRPPARGASAAVLDPPLFAPTPAFAGLPIPALATLGDLAGWAHLSTDQLDWLSDERRGHRRASQPPLQHYRCTFVPKRTGAPRLLEAPKARLKAIQRRILHEMLDAVPVHECAHGFVRGRSCITGAQAHASEAVVATFDLAQFFPSVALPRVHGLFRSLGYPWAVARRLAGLCTTITPASVFAASQLSWEAQNLYATPHLPQGAPTSPALANLIAWRLDQRLHGLARAAGATYTRYADDLAFSGDATFARALGRFSHAVGAVANEEGFALNPAKSRIMPRAGRQRITGIVVNAQCSVPRDDFDRLKAVLFNCGRHGPKTQNHEGREDFRAHLDGRVTWVEQVDPRRGAKLRALFERADWDGATSSAAAR